PPPDELLFELLDPQAVMPTASSPVTAIEAIRLRLTLIGCVLLLRCARGSRFPDTSAASSRLPARIEGVQQAVADQVERQHREQQRRSRKDHVPPGGVEGGGGVVDHLAPRRGGRADPDAEERERRLEQDVGGDQEA